MAGEESSWDKGLVNQQSPLEPAGHNLTQPGIQPNLEVSRPLLLPSGDSTLIKSHPQPALSSHPFLREIRPLASSGVYSPPSSQPLVCLPNHAPISPIPHISEEQPIFSPGTVFISPENQLLQRKRLNKDSHVKEWLEAHTPEQEWDAYNPLPTFQLQDEFWESRGLLPILDHNYTPGIQQIQQVRIVSSSTSDTYSADKGTCVSVIMSAREAEVMEAACSKINKDINKVKYLLSRLTEDDVDEDSVNDGLITER